MTLCLEIACFVQHLRKPKVYAHLDKNMLVMDIGKGWSLSVCHNVLGCIRLNGLASFVHSGKFDAFVCFNI